jgi:hypothetical protein
VIAGGVGALGAALVAALYVSDSAADPDEATDPTPTATVAAHGEAPSTPPVEICGNRDSRDGPGEPPAGAVRVSTSERLDDVTAEHPAGTTFWLEAGVHRMGTEEFDQVIPKDGNRYLGAPGAVLDGQRSNRYAFTNHATGVTIAHLTITNFGPRRSNSNEGVVNHNSATGWTIERNTISGNAGAGVMIGSGNVIRENCLAENGQYGFNAYHADAVRDIVLERNEITGNNTDDWEASIPGCGCTGGGKFWEVTGAEVIGNWVHDNRGVGLWADTNNAGFLIEGNFISANDAEGVVYETSYNAAIRNNTFVRNAIAKGPTNPSFPAGAIYISESGSDPRVASAHNEAFDISGNVLIDNWAGVILWENSDRFAGSPANTSTGANTLVNPGVVTAETCNAENIGTQPYIDDCRWKTQNVHVHDNVFTFSPEAIGTACVTHSGCGYNGLFANWGTFPDWSPYHGETVQDAITFDQSNLFYENSYSGPWHFVIHGQGNSVDWATWQGAPYDQDADSVIKLGSEDGH